MPPKPDSSTRSLISLLTIPSKAKSIFPVPTPSSSSLAVGSLIRARTANATGFWSNCDERLNFPPSQMSPNWLPDHPFDTRGYSLTSPPACELKKMGRASRSMRRTAWIAANSSARFLIPTPKVIGQFDTSVNPST